MKRIFMLLTVIVLAVSLFSQEGDAPEIDLSNSVFDGLEKGYKCNVEFGGLFGYGNRNYGANGLKLHIVNGYQFNPYLSVGAGTGIWYNLAYSRTHIPFFVDLKINFLNRRISPYFSIDSGGLLSKDCSPYTSKNVTLLVLLNPTLGVTYKVSDWFTINLGLGLEYTDMTWYCEY